MRIIYLLSITLFLISCSETEPKQEINQEAETEVTIEKVVVNEFQQLIDTADVLGSVLVYDPQKEIYYSNNFEWTEIGKLPASTFKIPNSIIALETGVVENDSTMFLWDGEKRKLPRWEQDLIFKEAFHLSCVPCYQDIARQIGVERMNEYLSKLEYGEMDVDSNNIDLFWLMGNSKVNQMQQIDFLKRLYNSELNISENTETIIKRLMIIDNDEKASYTLRGKTGWSLRDGNNNGWFVGCVEVDNKVFYFATNVEPNTEFDMNMFPIIRTNITMEALKVLEII